MSSRHLINHLTATNPNYKDCKKLFSIFDKDKSGTVSFDEFMRAIRGKMRLVIQHALRETYFL